MPKRHNRMKQEVGHFAHNFFFVVVLHGQQDFPGLFRHFFQDPIVSAL